MVRNLAVMAAVLNSFKGNDENFKKYDFKR